MAGKANTAKVKALQHQNDTMMKELQTLRNEFSRLQESLITHEAEASKHGGLSQQGPDPETVKSLQFVSDEYDNLTSFCSATKKDLATLKNRLKSLTVQVCDMADVLDDLVKYSYSFNIKLLGIPEIDPTSREPAVETTKLCIGLFNLIGANITLNDIDTAHRVPSRNSSSNDPKPIICKFVRRIAREEVMSHRREVSNVDPTAVGVNVGDLSNAMILDHLTPKAQELLSEAKRFKTRYNYAYCWAKNQVIYLRQHENSQPIKVKDRGVLQTMAQEESGI